MPVGIMHSVSAPARRCQVEKLLYVMKATNSRMNQQRDSLCHLNRKIMEKVGKSRGALRAPGVKIRGYLGRFQQVGGHS